MGLKLLRPRLTALDTSRIKPLDYQQATTQNTGSWRSGKNANARGYTYQWEKARANFLSANPLCARCKSIEQIVPATVVDHIVPHRGDKGLFWDADNWQPLCKKCHDQKTAAEGGGFGSMLYFPKLGILPTIPVSVVCGPPAAGKSTWIAQHKNPDDIVIDLDDLIVEMFGQHRSNNDDLRRQALLERNRRLQGLGSYKGPATGAWFATTAPRRWQRDHWAYTLKAKEVLLILTPEQKGRARVFQDAHRTAASASQLRLIRQWWQQYSPRPEDVIRWT